MKNLIRLISLLMVMLMCFPCGGNALVYAEEINIQNEEITTTTENLAEIEQTNDFFEDELEDIYSSQDWFIGETEEQYEGDVFEYNDSTYEPYDLNDPNEESDLNISVNGITGLLGSRYALATLLGVNWTTERKFLIQGGCSDGEYVYYAFHIYDLTKDANGKYLHNTIEQKILCAKLKDDGSVDTANCNVTSFDYLDHANSLTYNSKTDQVVVSNLFIQRTTNDIETEIETSYKVTVLNAAYLRGEAGATAEASFRYIPCKVSSIVYDEYEDQYIVGLRGKKYSFAILNSDFLLEKVVGYQPDPEAAPYDTDAWSRNDIWCDHSNIYALVLKTLLDDDGDAYGYKNILMVFDKEAIDNPDSQNITATEINLNSSVYYEAENIFRHKNQFFIGYSYIEPDVGNNYGYKDITADTFRVEYEPNYNMTNNVTGADSTRKNSLVIHCAATRLMPNTFANTGYKFNGWAAYYDAPEGESDLWYCDKADGTRGWVEALSPGDTLYRYADEQKIAQTVPKGGTVVMVAQWVQTGNFTVRFLSNDKNNLALTQECAYGKENHLTACNFVEPHKTAYNNNEETVFLGWHAHWVEGDKWYYQSADASTFGWYKEGEQPSGYIKRVYANQARVTKTVPKGHTVEMHAFWNEFTIYYFAGAKLIQFPNIKTPTTGIIRASTSTGVNSLSSYLSTGNTPWYAYYLEKDKWYYQTEDGNSKGWYTFGSEPNGYKKYINTAGALRNTAAAGDSIVLCWTAGTAETYDFVN